MEQSRDRQKAGTLFAIALGGAFFLLYLLTAAPSIVELYDDSLEFQLVGPTFGIAHPTGYPLYTLLGGIWSRVLFPVGNWAWRMNLFSAAAAAATVALLFLLTQEVVKQTRPNKQPSPQSLSPGLFAALAFGLSPIWWSQSTIAEVYALHNLLVVLALLLAVRLVNRRSILPQATRRVTLLALILGLGLAHHRTIVLLGPGLLLLLWGNGWLWRPSRHWLRWGSALLAPLLLYLYIPLRATMGVQDLNGSYVNSWAGFWHHILAQGYAGFFAENSLTRALSTTEWLHLWLEQYGIVGLLLGALGLGWLLWRGRNRRAGLALLVLLLTNLLFAVAYRVGDPEVFMVPAWLTFAPLIGAGVAALRHAKQIPLFLIRLLQTLLFFAIITGIGGRGGAINRSQDWAIHNYAVALAKVDFPPDSKLIGLEGQITALRYMQQAEDLAPNVQGIVADNPAQRVQLIATAVEAGDPTYLTQEVADIAERYSFSGEGPLVRVWPRGSVTLAAPESPLDLLLANGDLALTGYDQQWLDEAGAPALQIALYWQPQSLMKQTYKLSLRLFDRTGAPLLDANGHALTADRFPLRQVAPTTTWLPGETIRDVHQLSLSREARAKASELAIILYDAATVQEAGTVRIPLRP